MSVGIAYKEDTQKAREVILSTLKGDDRILPEPAPLVVVTGLGESSVNLQLRFWTEDPNQKYGLMFEYTEKCKKALDQAGNRDPFSPSPAFPGANTSHGGPVKRQLRKNGTAMQSICCRV